MSHYPQRLNVLSIAISAALLSSTASAGTFTVTSLNNDGPGTLRSALQDADGVSGAVVEFDPSLFGAPAQIALESQISLDSADVVIAGPGRDQLTITLEGSSFSRLFDFSGTSVTIQDLSIAGRPGHTYFGTGGLARITTESTNIVRTDFNAGRTDGGNGGCLALMPASTTDGGGASAVITDSTFSNCEIGSYGGSGGGVFASFQSLSLGTTSLMVTNSQFVNNAVGAGDGAGLAVENASVLSIAESEFSDNQAYGWTSQGGAIHLVSNGLMAQAFIGQSSIADNQAYAGGGGVFLDAPNLLAEVSASSLVNNGAYENGSALVVPQGQLSVVNTTISGNSVPSAVDLGIDVNSALFLHSTLTDNAGVAIRNLSPLSHVLDHSIVSGNAISAPIDLVGPFESSFSIIGTVNDESELIELSGTIRVDDPELGVLSDNGGPTLSHMPIEGGIAVEAGDPGLDPIPDFDQRGAGFPRLTPPRISIGSIEPEGQDISDLSISISRSGPASVPVDAPVSWEITVENLGPNELAGPVVFGVQNLPAGIEFSDFSTPFGTDCQLSTQGGAMCQSLVNVGEPAVLELSGTAREPGNVILQADIECPDVDPDCSNNSDVAEPLGITPVSDLGISITRSGPASVPVGTPVAWEISVENLGPSNPAEPVVFGVENLPPEVDFTAFSTPFGTDCELTAENGAICQSILNAGEPAVLELSGIAREPGNVTLQADVECLGVDPDCGNNTDSAEPLGITPVSDLSIAFLNGPNELLLGAIGTWSFSAENLGPSDIPATQAEFALPANLEILSVTVPAGVQCALPEGVGGLVTCDVSAFSAGSQFNADIEASAATVGSGVIAGNVACPDVDPDCSNNADVSGDIATISVSDLSLRSQTLTTDGNEVGDAVSVDFIGENLGPLAYAGAWEMVIAAPAGLSISTVGGAGECAPVGDGASWACAGMDFSLEQEAAVSVGLVVEQAGDWVISADLTCPDTDPDCSNNQATAAVGGVAPPPPPPQPAAVAVPVMTRFGLGVAAFCLGLMGLLGIRRIA